MPLAHLLEGRHIEAVIAVLSDQGSIELPGGLLEQLHLSAGDDLEVIIEDEDTITLRRVSHPPNRGLAELLVACPSPFDVPKRESDSSSPLAL